METELIYSVNWLRLIMIVTTVTLQAVTGETTLTSFTDVSDKYSNLFLGSTSPTTSTAWTNNGTTPSNETNLPSTANKLTTTSSMGDKGSNSFRTTKMALSTTASAIFYSTVSINIGNTTRTLKVSVKESLNVVVIIMIAVLVAITIFSIASGLLIKLSSSSPKSHTQLIESPSVTFDETDQHHYQRNSIMVMFDQTSPVDGPSIHRPSDATALSKARSAFLIAVGGSAAPAAKSGKENIGYDQGCDV